MRKITLSSDLRLIRHRIRTARTKSRHQRPRRTPGLFELLPVCLGNPDLGLGLLEQGETLELFTLDESDDPIGTPAAQMRVPSEPGSVHGGACPLTAKTGERALCANARATFVNIGEDGRPHPGPPLLAESDEDRRRAAQASERREQRRSPYSQRRASRELFGAGDHMAMPKDIARLQPG